VGVGFFYWQRASIFQKPSLKKQQQHYTGDIAINLPIIGSFRLAWQNYNK
jgi:hypothetical protein